MQEGGLLLFGRPVTVPAASGKRLLRDNDLKGLIVAVDRGTAFRRGSTHRAGPAVDVNEAALLRRSGEQVPTPSLRDAGAAAAERGNPDLRGLITDPSIHWPRPSTAPGP
jgi:hypothetical protein